MIRKITKLVSHSFIGCFFITFVYSGNPKTDSLIKVLNEKGTAVKGNEGLTDTNRLLLINKISQRLTKEGLFDESISYALFQKDISEKQIEANTDTTVKKVFKKHLAFAYNNLGSNNSSKGNFMEALKFQLAGYAVKEEIRDIKGMAGSCVNLGNVYYWLGNYPECLKSAFKALKLYESIDSDNGRAFCYNTIATVYLSQGKNKEALENYRAALRIRQKSDDKYNTAMVLSNIFIVLKNLKRYDQALHHLDSALLLRKELDDKSGLASCYTNMGEMQKELGDLESAMKNLQLSVDLKKELGEKDGLITSYINMVDIYAMKKQYPEAIKYGEICLKLSKETQSIENLKLSYSGLSDIYKHTGDYKKAYEYYNQFIVYRDSLNNVENTNKMMQSQMQYEYDKKAAADSVKVVEEKKVFAAQLKEEKTKRVALYGGLILTLLGAGFIFNRFRITKKQKNIIEIQKNEVERQKQMVERSHTIIEEKQREILDSINYAKRIQYALLANKEMLNTYIPDNFIFFKPKDIVSGDFYWGTWHNNHFYLCICDSTGHGVPGAFMCLLNIGFISEAINEKNIAEPHRVFNYVRDRLINSISKEGQKDGFDGILMCIKPGSNKITYAAANNSPMLIRNGQMIKLECDKMPVGKGERTDSFSEFVIDTEKGDNVYFYTDGYADQFGGPKGKKFKYQQLNSMLINNSNESMTKQMELLMDIFEDWRGPLEQVDDVCVIGMKVS
jgi:serine phosphatase RsbU (regulator of sigma subunit)/Tfp pilus assembly protein PilF